ncbi:MAG: AMP-binding protein [Deltaproteobacteria bacterium]|nr:AMP-binding protein [Deltaproteobacteria bacterium]
MDAKEVYTSKPWIRYYPKGVPAEVEIPDISVPGAFDQMADKYSGKTALIFYGRKISYKELKTLTDRFATALAGMGVKKGDTVALYLLNCPQYVIAYFGALKAGAKVTPISPVYTSKEVRHQIDDSQAGTVICEDILYDNVEKSGAEPDHVILTSIGDYLPRLKRMFAKSKLAQAYGGEMAVPTQADIKKAGLHLFQDLIEQNPPDPPKSPLIPRRILRPSPTPGEPPVCPRRPS